MDKFTSAALLLTLMHFSATGHASEDSGSSKSVAEAVARYRPASVVAEQMRKPSNKIPINTRARSTRPVPPVLSSDKPRLSSPGRGKGRGE
jgi:hypothetical protein